jgi:transcriptional regulator with XRE-family HTH domain
MTFQGKESAMSLALETSRASDAASVVSKAVTRAADRLGLTGRDLAAALGLSEASVSRLKRGDFQLDQSSKHFELALLLIRLYRSLDGIVGGDVIVARAWMGAQNVALGGVPARMIATISGLHDVIDYLDARRALV